VGVVREDWKWFLSGIFCEIKIRKSLEFEGKGS
jgi:hypothetical protein